MNWLDMVLLSLLAVAAVSGYKRGLLRVLASAFAFAGGLYTGYLAAPVAVAWQEPHLGLVAKLSGRFMNWFNISASVGMSRIGDLPGETLPELVGTMGVPVAYRHIVAAKLAEIIQVAPDTKVVQALASMVAKGVVTFAAVLLIAFLVAQVLNLVASGLTRTLDGTLVVGRLNHWFGAALQAAVMVVMTGFLLSMFKPLTALPFAAGTMIHESRVAQALMMLGPVTGIALK